MSVSDRYPGAACAPSSGIALWGFALTILILTIACSPEAPDSEAEGTWAGTITTEGNVTAVVNESGSVWGETARLVEEVSIGVEAGADEYMFGEIASLYANRDRIAVLDRQVQVVRLYDAGGNFVSNVGGPGSGPGEFQRAVAVTMDESANVYVLDDGSRRVSRFAPDGSLLESWPVPAFWCCGGTWFPAPEGRVWLALQERLASETRGYRYGVQAQGPAGPYGDVHWLPETDFTPPSFEVPERTYANLPFAPSLEWAVTSSGGIVVGSSDWYRFEIVRRGGDKTVVEHYVERAPVGQEEWEWNRLLVVAVQNQGIPGWSWDGAELPRYRPAFGALAPAVSGEIWVRRETGSQRLPDCTDNPLDTFSGSASGRLRHCYAPDSVVDVFGSDGRYLGEVDTPAGFNFSAFHANGRVVVAVTTDASGTLRVKRYRILLPGDS